VNVFEKTLFLILVDKKAILSNVCFSNIEGIYLFALQIDKCQ